MTHGTCKTVKIKSSDPKSQGDFVEINESDFDPKKHEKYEGDDEVSAPVTPAKKIKATADAHKFAEDAGFDISTVKGTGRGGIITVEDVQDAIEAAEESES